MTSPRNISKEILEEIKKLESKADGTVVRISFYDGQISMIVNIYKDEDDKYYIWDSSNRAAKQYDCPLTALEECYLDSVADKEIHLSIVEFCKFNKGEIP